MVIAFVNALIVLPPDLGGPRYTTLRFDRPRILSIDRPPAKRDRTIDLNGAIVYPGLINAHDHLELNHYPRSKFREVYENAREWSLDFTPRLDQEPYLSLRQMPLTWRCLVGGLKNRYSGVTTVAHHNPLHSPLRSRDFPVRVVQRYGWAHSLYLEPDVKNSYRRTPRAFPWMIHLAEGTDTAAHDELDQLDRLGCLQANTVLIHGVALDAAQQERVIEVGAGLVWCPSSNLFLLGKTADVQRFAKARRLALGTDSALTADGDMLDELRAAYTTGQLTAEEIFRAVTIDAARLLRLHQVGEIRPGFLADLIVVVAMDNLDSYTRLVTLKSGDVLACWRKGQPD